MLWMTRSRVHQRLVTTLSDSAARRCQPILGHAKGDASAIIPGDVVRMGSKITTFMKIQLSPLGSALAGLHYFGDFERFAAISESTASKLSAVKLRLATLCSAHDEQLAYRRVADLARVDDECVIAEIEHWQDGFSGKDLAGPV
jgi:hypothetical protein